MVMVSIEFLLIHNSKHFEVSRVPCVGEIVAHGDETFEVRDVIHILDADKENEPVAIVRVK